MSPTQRIPISGALAAFIDDCRASNLTPGTIGFYLDKLPPSALGCTRRLA